MLKLISNHIAVPLTIIFNDSLKAGKFPDMWKLAHVIPLYKKDDSSKVCNYRPISLLSCIGKIFERVVFKYVFNYLVENNLLYKLQSGFLPNHSTTHQLIDIYHNILLSLENKHYTSLVFCDFSKAFDRVWHRGLILKLENYGFTGSLLSWFKDYLYNRKQCVKIANHVSETKSITSGVPQGSVLGPLLFLIYINDIADSLSSICNLYADDTSLMFSSADLLHLQTVTNNDIVKLQNWSKKWLMSFNPSKTEIMLISYINLQFVPNFTFDNTDIPVVDTHKH